MKHVLPLALAAMLLVPTAHAQTPERGYEYPAELLSLLPGWIAEAEAMATDEDRAKPWWPEAASFLQSAKDAQAEGRFRVTLFHVETFRELLAGHRLMEEATAAGGSGKALVPQRTSGVHDDADAAWLAFRAKLHAYDGQLRSLQTVEKVLYAADLGLAGALAASDYDELAEAFPQEPGLSEGYVFGLVRASSTALADIEWAEDVLAKAVEQEGIPPQIVAENWTRLTAAALDVPSDGSPPIYLEALDGIMRPARENDEGLLAVASVTVEQRLGRAQSMQTIFGDARTRGLDVVNDAARGMRRAYNNTTMETPRGYGLSGVFTADAIDRAQVTLAYLEEEKADLGTVIVAWSTLEGAAFMNEALATSSPVAPPPATPSAKETPGPAIAGVLVVGALVALASRRR